MTPHLLVVSETTGPCRGVTVEVGLRDRKFRKVNRPFATGEDRIYLSVQVPFLSLRTLAVSYTYYPRDFWFPI